MARSIRPFALLSSCLLIALSLASCAKPDVHRALRSNFLQTGQGGPMLLAAYQPWFGRPGHINVGYSSQDRVAVDKQIEQAKSMGIEGFVANWYGSRKDFEDRSYAILQEEAGRNNFKVAIMYDEDDSNPGEATDSVIVDLQYAYDRYISSHAQIDRSAYLTYEGRPVIFIFPKGNRTDWNRIRQMTNAWNEKPLLIFKDIYPQYMNAFDGFYAWVSPGNNGWQRDGSAWGGDYLEGFYHDMATKYPDKIAVGAAWPGFNDSQASWSRNRHMDSRCGKTFEDSLRMYHRYFNDQRPLPFLMIVTWNDYEEGTAIERGFSNCGDKRGSQVAQQTP